MKDIRRYIRGDVMKLALPVLTEQVFMMSMGVVNTIMASRLGNEAVSAIGMVDSISNILIAFFSSLAVGATVVVAHYSGQNNSRGANEATGQAMMSGFLLAVLTTILTWILRYQLINILFGAAEKLVIDNSMTYLGITLLSYPMLALTSIACGVLRGAGDTRTPMKITIAMNIVNVILCWLMIYGVHFNIGGIRFGIEGMEVKGAALAITIARAFGTAAVLYTLIKGSKSIRLSLASALKFNVQMQKSIFGIGVPASVESLLFNIGKLLTQVFIVGMGTASVAANTISGSITGIINIPGSALSTVATTMVGQYMGKRDEDNARGIMSYVTIFSSVSLGILCLLAFPFGGSLASLYTSDPEVIRISTNLIRLSSATIPLFWSVSFVLPAGLRGAGDARYTMVTAIIGMWLFRITFGYIIGVPMKLGVAGVWIGMYVDWVVRGFLYVKRLRNGKWRGNVVVKSAGESIEKSAEEAV